MIDSLTPSVTEKIEVMIPEGQIQWYCVHTKPKCEHIVAGALKQMEGVEPWCPRLRFQRSTPRGKVWFTEALFPSYLFARYDPTKSARAVAHAHNVIRVVSFGGHPVPVPEQSILDLKAEMHGSDLREVTHEVRVGDSVEVAEGPMRGMKGIVECFLSGQERVRVLLEFLGRETLVQMPAGKLLNTRSPRESLAADQM